MYKIPLPKLTIKAKIFLTILGLLLISIISLTSIILINLKTIGHFANQTNVHLGNQVMEDSSMALEKFTEERLFQMATDQAELSNALFRQIQAETETIASYAELIYQHPSQYKTRKSYSKKEKPSAPVQASMYILAKNTKRESIQIELNLLSVMDDIFIALFDKDPNLSHIFIGTQSGIFKGYPWLTGLDDKFDHRTRPWFQNALKQTKKTGWTDLYIDASGGGLMITCFSQVKNPRGKIVAVIGTDVSLETINKKLINAKIGNAGYAFLIDHEGGFISRPGITNQKDLRWDESFDSDNLLNHTNSKLRELAKKMINQEQGIQKVQYNQEEKYVAYAPIASTQWSIGLVLPRSEIIQPISVTKTKIMIAAYQASQELAAEMKKIYGILIVVMVLITLGFMVIALQLSKKITQPILKLNQGAKIIGSGNLDYQFDIQTGDEIEQLATTFNKMTKDIQQYMHELNEKTLSQEKIKNELKLARTIQENMLPDQVPIHPKVEFGVISIPAKIIGGDYYDFFDLGHDKIGILIADIVGKGIPAALYMVVAETIIHSAIANCLSPKTALEKINLLMCQSPMVKKYVPVFYGVLDTKTLKFYYCNAGHEPALAFQNNKFKILDSNGFPLGGAEDSIYEEKEIHLNSNDRIFFYTDGITEARNTQEEDFGLARLKDLIKKSSQLSAGEITDQILETLQAYTQNAIQHDDLTMITLRIV